MVAVKPIPSPHTRTSLTKTGKRINNGRRLIERTARWMEGNKSAFFAIYRYVKTMQSEENSGRVRDRVAAWCVDNLIKVGDDDFRFSNDFWAGISRYLVIYDDSLLDAPIIFRDSDIDCYGLLPVSYLPTTHRKDA